MMGEIVKGQELMQALQIEYGYYMQKVNTL